MKRHTCEDALNLIQQAITQECFASPSTELCADIASCNTCKGALALLLADIIGAPPPPLAVSAQQCEEDLAAYIDLEMLENTHIAISEYPHVWWHLWTSPDLAETYRLTVSLMKAEQDGNVPPLRLETSQRQRPARLFPQLRVSNTVLQHTLSPQKLLGKAHGAEDETPILIEEQRGAYKLGMNICKQGNGTWNVTIKVLPPTTGWAVLSRGNMQLMAPFDQQGQAVFSSISTELITAIDGVDLVVSIHTGDEPPAGAIPTE